MSLGLGVCVSLRNAPLCPATCLSLRSTLPPAPPEAEAMASKPEKRVASSVFITLAPPRREETGAEGAKRAAGEARPGCPWKPPTPTKAPGAGSAGRPSAWLPPGRAAATGPAVPPQLSNGGKRVRGGRETGSKAALGHSFTHSSIEHLLCVRQTLQPWVRILAPPLLGCVMLTSHLKPLVPPFPNL